MRELMIDFITSLDGYASGEGWPGFWGLEGPEYLAWLGEQPEVTYVMGANTYRLMSGFAAGETPEGTDEFTADEEASVDGLTQAPKVVFSSSLEDPLTWANSTLVRDDAVEAVRAMKADGSGLISTIGSLSLCRSLLPRRAGRSLPGRHVPGHHRCHGSRTHLRRLPRRRPRHDRPPHLRRQHPAGRVPAARPGAPTTRVGGGVSRQRFTCRSSCSRCATSTAATGRGQQRCVHVRDSSDLLVSQ